LSSDCSASTSHSLLRLVRGSCGKVQRPKMLFAMWHLPFDYCSNMLL